MREIARNHRSGLIIGLVCCADGLRTNEPRAQRGVGLIRHREDPSLRSGLVEASARARWLGTYEPRAQRGVGISQQRSNPPLRSGLVEASARAGWLGTYEPRAQRGVGCAQGRSNPSLRSGLVEASARAWWLALLCAVGFACPALADIKPIPLSPTAVAAGAQITYDKGIEFVTIGSPGNAAWPGNGVSGDRAIGRGSVGYEYKIGRFEVTTSQWVDFFNAAYDRPSTDWLPHLAPPGHWGAVAVTPNTAGGRRWAVPAGNEMIPVGNISWRMAAMYCNWLTNDQSSDRSAFLNGAYDVGTFGYTGDVFTDQLTHSPQARFWIPTRDEWLKAAHFDPNKPGSGQGGSGVAQWWNYSITSDIAPIYGPPGTLVNGKTAQANAGFTNPSPFGISLGSYVDVQSPWGLLDTAGGTSEWLEEAVPLHTDRGAEGSAWGYPASVGSDTLRGIGGDFPSLNTFDYGFRVAGQIPAPGTGLAIVLGLSRLLILRRRR